MEMIPTSDIAAKLDPLSGVVFKELSSHDWSQQFHAVVDELGLAMGSHIGLRRNRNEDRVAAARLRALSSEIYTVSLVCDGVGGSEAGNVAAGIAIAAVVSELHSQRVRPFLPELTVRAVRKADELVRQTLGGRGTTTLTMVVASASGQIVCASVGDSRIYSWGSQSKLIQLSTDDTVENELRALPGDHHELLRARGLKGSLSQALGEGGRTADELRVQVFTGDQFTSGVLLGTDGLWKLSRDFEAVMLNAPAGLDAVRRGISLANWVGGLDNASLVAIDNLERFQSVKSEDAASLGEANLILWVGTQKMRLISQIQQKPTIREKSEKQKRRPSSPKSKKIDPSGGQLDFSGDKAPLLEPRPIIEVTLGSSGEKED